MHNLRKVEYYVSDRYTPNSGFMDGGDADDNETGIALFHRFADSRQFYNDEYHPQADAIFEIEETGEVKQIESWRIKRFIND